MIETVYIVKVHTWDSGSVTKAIEKRQVKKITTQYVTVEDYGTAIRIPVDKCYTDPERASAECESRANELIAQLVRQIEMLKQPAEIPTAVRGVFGEFYGPDDK